MARQAIDILLVEDNPGDVELIRLELEAAGITHRLHVARDGRAALQYLEQARGGGEVPRPKVILLDLNLPGIDGHGVLRAIKADEDLKTIPVIVLTSSAAREDIEASYSAHANCYVTKPFDMDEMGTMVRALDRWWFQAATLPPA